MCVEIPHSLVGIDRFWANQPSLNKEYTYQILLKTDLPYKFWDELAVSPYPLALNIYTPLSHSNSTLTTQPSTSF